MSSLVHGAVRLQKDRILAVSQKTTSQFYLYGRWHFTKTGYEAAAKKYPQPDLLEGAQLDLSGKIYMITGANAGIGKEIASFLASKGATIFMVCRSADRAEASRQAIVQAAGNDKVHVLLGDCGREADIRRIWSEFTAHPSGGALDCLICNAGALLNERTLTSEGVEVTFATHLLFGTYLLTKLALPLLALRPGSRAIAVSSGGMYNTKFPAWETATSTGLDAYDGQFAYAYAKRGQVLVMEQLAALHPAVSFLSCHPGWTQTDALDKAYGDSKSYLEPLRTPWQGAEGIVWLAVAPADQLQSGGFYLDRKPQAKHMAGMFFNEGSYTKNTPEEVEAMMSHLEQWSERGQRPSQLQLDMANARRVPLLAMDRPIDIESFMGDWYVLAAIPSSLEQNVFNSTESYRWKPASQTIKVRFTYHSHAPAKGTQPSEIKMKATISNAPLNSQWSLNPRIAANVHLPLRLTYLIVDLADDLSYTTISVPDRSYLWIMIRRLPNAYPRGDVPVTTAYALQLEDNTLPEEEPSDRWEWERYTLQKAVRRAVDLGFDPSKILRNAWSNESVDL